MLLGYTLDRQLGSRPEKTVFCTKCVVSNQRPRITFDENGVCSACKYAEEKHKLIDWEERERELRELLDRHRSTDGSFDCIVPGSGGKDSSYVAHQLKYKYGMHPLTVTWAPFEYTDIGWKNYIAFKDSGFDNLLCFPNGILHRKLSRLAFELLGDAWEPFAYGQKAYAFQMAQKFNIPLMFYGESGEVEYGGSVKNKDKSHETPEDWQDFYYKGSGIDELVKHGLDAGIFSQEEIDNNPFPLYRPPASDKLTDLNAEMHWFSYYTKWVPQENYYYAVEHTGFKANSERSEGTYSKYASLDDKQDGFHFYLAYLKFGIARATSDAAHEIRDGHLTREEGVALVKRYDGEFPQRHCAWFIEYLGLSEEEFRSIIDFYQSHSPNIWAKVGSEWKLRNTVWGGGVDD
jgi:N-acetyl sugar amidotransferase